MNAYYSALKAQRSLESAICATKTGLTRDALTDANIYLTIAISCMEKPEPFAGNGPTPIPVQGYLLSGED